MKNLIYLLMAMPLLFTSCSKDDEMASEETVQVSFRAELPRTVGTRASDEYSYPTSVDRVYCAVFEDDEEIKGLRQEIRIEQGQPIVFEPRLIRGRTYDIVFWASKEGSYDVRDMTAITRNTGVDEKYFDAFTAAIEIIVSGNNSDDITLYRPLAQLNMGVTEEDWNGVANPDIFDMTPTTIQITMDGYETFNALEGIAENPKTLTYSLVVSGASFTCESNTYKNIAQCYILAESEKENIDITYTICDQDDNEIRSNVQISSVPFQRNYITNVVGGLLTGQLEYTVSFGYDFSFQTDDDHNKEIE